MAGIDESTLLLLHGESLLDSGFYNVPVQNNGVQVLQTQSKFGGSSLYFDGSSYLTVPLSSLGLDFNSNWTIDWWEYDIGSPQFSSANFSMPIGSAGFIAGSISSGKTRIFAGDTGVWGFIPITNFGNLQSNTWVHRALCKEGSTLRAFENGQIYNTINISGTITMQDVLYIGYRATTSNFGGYKGYLDEIRISNVSRWSGNFSPQESEYTAEIPDSPSNFHQIKSVVLKWGSVKCNGYKLYKNSELIADTTETQYIDTFVGDNEDIEYTVTAYNGNVESIPVTIQVQVREGYTILIPVVKTAFFQ